MTKEWALIHKKHKLLMCRYASTSKYLGTRRCVTFRLETAVRLKSKQHGAK